MNYQFASEDPQSWPRLVSAKYLGLYFNPPLSIGFIRSLQRTKAIPFHRLGRRVLFDPTEVMAALKKGAP